MRHATPEDLEQVAGLLEELRSFPQLTERKLGNFSRGSKAFLHFHVDGADTYVDVKLDGRFERMRAASPVEQAELLDRVAESLESASIKRRGSQDPQSGV